jgi:GT2 family glycosyltransferase
VTLSSLSGSRRRADSARGTLVPGPPPVFGGRPVATIVVPVLRQRADWLRRCIRSACRQSVPCEVVVVTAAATPTGTLAVLAALRTREASLVVLSEHRPGFAAAINTGIQAANSERVGLLLSDDWLDPVAAESCLPHATDLVSTGLRVYAADGVTELTDLGRSPSQAAFERRPTIETKAAYLEHFFLFRRSALLAVGGVDESIGCTGADDYDLIWTLLEHGASVTVLPDRLYNYRDHAGERLTLREATAQVADLEKILDKHGVHGADREVLLKDHAWWFGRPVQVAARELRGR